MADTRLTDLTALTIPATGDKLYIVDISDTTDSSAGSARQITFGNLIETATITFTNKTFNLSSNTLSGTLAQFNTALSDDNFVSLTGTETLTNKTLTSPTITGPTITGTVAGGATYSSPVLTTPKFADLGYIADANGAEMLIFDTTTTAVNNVQLSNAATTFWPEIQSVGDDTDIAIGIKAKGDADVKLTGTDVDLTGATMNVTVAGTDPWRTIDLTPGFLKPTTTAGCAASTKVEAGTNDIDYDVLDFDSATDENAYANVHMPDSWDGGTVQFRYVWTNAAGLTTETVVFELSGRSYSDSDAIDQVVGTAIEVSDTWLAQGDVHISAWSANVTLTGAGAGDWVHFEVMRDVSEDNLTGDARLMGVQIRYKMAQYTD